MDISDFLTSLAWTIVAMGCAAGVVHRTCRSVIECIALGWISLSATARAWSTFHHQYVEPPDLILAIAAATYVAVHVRKGFLESRKDKEWEKKLPGEVNETKD